MVVRAQFAKSLVQQYRKNPSEQRCEAGQHRRSPTASPQQQRTCSCPAATKNPIGKAGGLNQTES